jgi:DNA repair photolyase
MIREITAKKVLTFHEDAYPSNWDVNPYRGCTVGCRYCYAQYTHRYLDAGDFFSDILVKTNAAECLDRELSHPKWKGAMIKIGGTTDLYQHAEKRYSLIPDLLRVVLKHRNPVFIQTKSTLILRDFDLICQLASVTSVDIATSVTTLDEGIRKIIEPGASPTRERLEMLAAFAGICRSTVTGIMPVIPLLTDGDDNLEALFRFSAEHKIDHVVSSFLFLRGEVRTRFMKLMEAHFPTNVREFSALYRNGKPDKIYAASAADRIQTIRNKYGMLSQYHPPPESGKPGQLSLF